MLFRSIYLGSEPNDDVGFGFNHWMWLEKRAPGCPFWQHVKKPDVYYNCGIVGGIAISEFTKRLGFLNSMCSGLNDMHALMYAAQDAENIVTGYPVHNLFGSHEATDEWFKHK